MSLVFVSQQPAGHRDQPALILAHQWSEGFDVACQAFCDFLLFLHLTFNTSQVAEPFRKKLPFCENRFKAPVHRIVQFRHLDTF